MPLPLPVKKSYLCFINGVLPILLLMKNRAICMFIAGLSLWLSACKKEEVSNQQLVKNHFLGKWPHKKTIRITLKNNDTLSNDTLYYGLDSPAVVLPVDTVIFGADSCIKNKQKMAFTVDATGDHITYGLPTLGTWKIAFIQPRRIILSRQKTETEGSDMLLYYEEEQLIR
ncbi:hypothetical protein D9M68_493140 [compost metagenome]